MHLTLCEPFKTPSFHQLVARRGSQKEKKQEKDSAPFVGLENKKGPCTRIGDWLQDRE